MQEPVAEPRRILLIQSRWMGDVLLCTPAVRALRRAFPSARLVFATEAPGADALRGNPHLDEVVVLGRGWRDAFRVQRRLRGEAFDVVVDFRSTGSTARVTAFSGAPVRIGWQGRGPRTLAYTHLQPRRGGPPYAGLKKLVLLEPLGVTADQAEPALEITVGQEERDWAARVWREQGLDGRAVVALSPLSRTRHKQWGVERWAAVTDALVESGLAVIVASGPDEEDQIQALLGHARQRLAWDAGARSVRDLAALYQRSLLWVGNDGGLKHVAVAAGAPTVTVCRWKQTGHWTDARPEAEQWALEEAPPGGCDLRCTRCAHLACLGAISADRVLATVRDAIARVGGQAPTAPSATRSG
jgi:ADP-heptose:LPS heptosyltransferase